MSEAGGGGINSGTSTTSRRGMERHNSTTSGSNRKERREKSMHHSRESVNTSMASIETADQQKAATAIMNWSNNLVRFRVISVTKCFYKWKYFVPPQATVAMAANSAATDGETVESPEKIVKQTDTATIEDEEIAEQKHSYLVLFAENEKLREQLTDLRKSTNTKEKKLRMNAMKSCISVILRSRCTSKLRYYYDVWIHTTKAINLVNTATQRTLQLLNLRKKEEVNDQ